MAIPVQFGISENVYIASAPGRDLSVANLSEKKTREDAMPADFELDVAARTVRSRGWGAVTDGDLFNHVKRIRELFKDGTVDSTWVQILDSRAVESFADISSSGIQHTVYLNPWPKNSRRAILTSTDLGFALSRMYQIQGMEQNENLRIFRSKAQAIEWVTQERDGFDPSGKSKDHEIVFSAQLKSTRDA